ncbi:chemotaxis protein CheX [Azoarcus sp. DN11]|uniref:chemotaxis protein CheX n=1 Tax=Azoarcus sp. DN11 TaxID=356837 RepID=UPI000EAD44F8|nr:chemotaxis protein CheX [Azoarcus sp. DN11]AYH44284.1 hypothetical protein CDA09_12950 [Azoarcus sp. DN11]
MNYRALTHEDIEVFSEAISVFFLNMTHEAAVVRTAYILDGTSAPLWGDFNGVIDVSGGFRGSITFSAPYGMLSRVLEAIGEREHSVDRCLDVVGEIANMMSGRARRHFGEELAISTPASRLRTAAPTPVQAAGAPFAIPLRWHNFEANLVVHLDIRR